MVFARDWTIKITVESACDLNGTILLFYRRHIISSTDQLRETNNNIIYVWRLFFYIKCSSFDILYIIWNNTH